MTAFNAKRSRAKRPCPLWVDAFQRDTQHLEADEVGAYMLILMAMWTREECDLPDDDNRLARVSRLSIRLWKSRIGPVIRAFLTADDGVVFSGRLRREATYVERQVKQQSDRKVGEKSGKSLKNNKQAQTVDSTTEEPRHHPSQQPNNPREVDKSTSSQEAADYQRYLKAQPKPVESDAGAALFSALLADGIEADRIIAAAVAYAETVKTWSGEAKVQQSDNFLCPERGQWKKHHPKPQAVVSSQADILAFWAEKINGTGFVAAGSINAGTARALLEARLVTPEKLKERGIAA